MMNDCIIASFLMWVLGNITLVGTEPLDPHPACQYSRKLQIRAGLPSKISPAPTMFSASVPLPAENFDDGSTEEPEHPDMKENPLKESAPFLQEWSSYNEPEKQPHIS
ncbi:uncharacterized protein LOC123395449 [Hordeum vulgare subsp. vulgare]|uniref:uncharacterized protein LOC123395449 n=1 Tax=Hordeum vulgare subsp. vulgare TaxID=112509 RepID=UPI001D1A3F11|nr:uncharacterized protein LOC123395449 [Hordeum vulgare subsp. vulgare]